MNWPFLDAKNTAVFATKSIMNGVSAIKIVYHHLEDGAWEFQDGFSEGIENIAVLSLEEITLIDNTVLQLHDLEYGFHAYRNSSSESWKIKKTI